MLRPSLASLALLGSSLGLAGLAGGLVDPAAPGAGGARSPRADALAGA
ncbi:MAG: hypothetical protein OXN85_08920 [Gemmatimonadetes bacterium]|nr:hypothetical protein [Candidatus Palauibacter australiensis]